MSSTQPVESSQVSQTSICDREQVLLCGTVIKRKKGGFRLAKVKTPGHSIQAVHSVASKNAVSSGHSFENTTSRSKAQSDCWQSILFCDTWSRKYIV